MIPPSLEWFVEHNPPAELLDADLILSVLRKLGFEERALCVFQHLLEVRPGQTITYGELARRCCVSPRYVGWLMRHNPFFPIVPCHRVVGKTDLGGYILGTAVKRALLNLENEWKRLNEAH